MKRVVGIVLLLASLVLFAYPAAMSVLSSFEQEEVATTVLSVADETNDEKRLGYLAQAKKYNQELAKSAGMIWKDDSVGMGGNAGTDRDIIHLGTDEELLSMAGFSDDEFGRVEETDGTTEGTQESSTQIVTVNEDGTREIEVSSSDEVIAFYEGLHADAMRMYPQVVARQDKSIAYINQLSWRQPDILGVLEIPAIGTRLVIRHGTEEAALAAGAGHLSTSSLPVGGLGSHCVLSGHSGMRTARMFDDLNLMKEGDVFLIGALDDVYAYRVYSIEDMVEPEDVPDHCRIEAGRDLCTLFTCTPYGVNSHRLLVHGERIPYDADSEDVVWNMTRVYVNNMTRPLILAVSGMVVLWLVVMIVVVVRRILSKR